MVTTGTMGGLSTFSSFAYASSVLMKTSKTGALVAAAYLLMSLVMGYVAVIVGMALTLVMSYVVLRTASSMVRFLGQGGIDAMTRIFGFLLICIGVQILWNGASALLATVHVKPG